MTAGDVLLTPPPDVQAAREAAVDTLRAQADAEVALLRAQREHRNALAAVDRAHREAAQAALLGEMRTLGWEGIDFVSPTSVAARSGGLTVRVHLVQGRPNYIVDWAGSRAQETGSGSTLRDALARLAHNLRRRYEGREPLAMAARLESAIGGAP